MICPRCESIYTQLLWKGEREMWECRCGHVWERKPKDMMSSMLIPLWLGPFSLWRNAK